MNRIGTSNGIFTGLPKGIKGISREDINVVILGTSPLSRSYYADSLFRDASTPTCWSTDSQTPSRNVSEEGKQSTRCLDCTHDILGSAANGGRACRFFQKLAVSFEGSLDKVYQLHVSAVSIFGKRGNSLRGYSRFLKQHDTAASTLFTRIYFEEDVEAPKLLFYPKRPLEEEEMSIVVEVISSEAATTAMDTDTYVGIDLTESPFSINESGFTTT
jgi:hypothetical protein|tara:strand:+ start:2306 stop:2953 length:648 start_codon:yes stop_codon:yes gene_type:complete